MLTLPQDWRQFHGGAVALCLFRQIPQSTSQREFAGHLIGAALELAIAGLFQNRPPPDLTERHDEFTWQIRDCVYVYFPEIDNRALAKAVELESCAACLTIIVPPRHDEVFQRACESILGDRTPVIWSLDGFVSFRTIFSSVDLRWSNERVVVDLLRRSNRRAAESHSDESILVDIPTTSE